MPMTFLIGKLAWFLLCPTNLLLLALAGGLAARHWLLGRRIAGAALLALLLAVLLPVGQWLRMPLETRFPPPPELGQVDGVIALGGGIDPQVSAYWGQPAIGGTAERFTTLVEMSLRWPRARLAFTGGIGQLGGAPATEAAILREFLRGLGLDERRLLLEDRARTTRENALLAKTLLQPQPGQTWLLVTSAAHMPRSIGVFREIGWEVVPWPVDYRTAGWWGGDWRPRAGERLAELDEAGYEWLGLVYYRMLGWTAELFPAP
jgi:uncharacterized SAM-binding protein YcdF (DUF218 family)